MNSLALLIAAFLLPSFDVSGGSPNPNVFIQKGDNILLDVIKDFKLDDTTEFVWLFNNTRIAKLFFTNKTIIFGAHKGRAALYANGSLLLNNLQLNESGSYIALLSAAQDSEVVKYELTVEEPVSPVSLMGKSVNLKPCNFTVTCSSAKVSRNFTCDNTTCSPLEEKETSQSIKAYVQQDFIICNYSNHVSWKQDKKGIKAFCTNSSHTVLNEATIAGIGTSVLISAGFLVFYFYCKKNKDKKKSNDNTVYDNPQDISSAQTQTQEPVTSTYALVQFPKKPEHPTDTGNTSSPETIYAQVMKREKPNYPPMESPTSDLYST